MSKININGTSETRAAQATRGSETKRLEGGKTPTIENKPAVSTDKLEFSDRAADVKKLVEKLEELPDIRQERVETLRGQITAGEYNPPSTDIADAILKDEK